MTAVIIVDSAETPLRYRVASAVAAALAMFRALGAEVEDAVIWRGNPDLAHVCLEVEGEHVVVRIDEPYCRHGVVEVLDVVDPLEVSVKIVKYSAEYDVVGLFAEGRSRYAIVSAEVYAPGSATLLGYPPIDANVDVEAYLGDGKVESFYHMFLYAYDAYAKFVERLAEELERPIGNFLKPPTHFLDRIAVTSDPYTVDEESSLPLFCKDLAKCLGLHRLPSGVQDGIKKIADKAFVKIGGLLLPRPEEYKEFAGFLKRLAGSGGKVSA